MNAALSVYQHIPSSDESSCRKAAKNVEPVLCGARKSRAGGAPSSVAFGATGARCPKAAGRMPPAGISGRMPPAGVCGSDPSAGCSASCRRPAPPRAAGSVQSPLAPKRWAVPTSTANVMEARISDRVVQPAICVTAAGRCRHRACVAGWPAFALRAGRNVACPSPMASAPSASSRGGVHKG
eukprot:4566279-Prymnesium_polylepis.2